MDSILYCSRHKPKNRGRLIPTAQLLQSGYTGMNSAQRRP